MNHSDTGSRLRSRLRAETRTAILGAAERVISEDGFHTARMEKIAVDAGVSVGTIYNHFKDRSALLQALFDDRVSNLVRLLDARLVPLDGGAAGPRIEAIFEAMQEHGQVHGRFFGAVIQAYDGPARLRPPARVRLELTARIRRIVEDGVAGGELRPGDPDLFVETLVALARLVLTRAIEGNGGPEESRSFVELFLRGAAR